MLPVVQWLALVGLTALQQQGITSGADGQGLGTRHAVEMECTATHLPHRHQHPPVDAAGLVGAARAALVVELQEGIAVNHQYPRAGHHVPRPHRGRIRQPGGTGAHPGHGDTERALGHARHPGHVGRVVMLLPDLGCQAASGRAREANPKRDGNQPGDGRSDQCEKHLHCLQAQPRCDASAATGSRTASTTA